IDGRHSIAHCVPLSSRQGGTPGRAHGEGSHEAGRCAGRGGHVDPGRTGMNLRPRHREDPEINLISMIDVLLVLLIFFMVSTTFNQEGRVKVQLPQASEVPLPRGTHEPLVITAPAEGGYRVNERALINANPETLRSALVKEAGTER